MDLSEAIETRSSSIRLTDPSPAKEELQRILQAGVHIPDHGRLGPSRFVVCQGKGRDVLADAMATSFLRSTPEATQGQLDLERKKAWRAPTIIVVAAQINREHKVPPIEQTSAVAAGVQNMFLTAHAMGYGVMWKTGAPAYDPLVNEALGLASDAQIVAFLYIGTIGAKGPIKPATLDGIVHWL